MSDHAREEIEQLRAALAAKEQEIATLENKAQSEVAFWERKVHALESALAAAMTAREEAEQARDEAQGYDVIDHIKAHWFTQGGKAAFGPIDEATNADEIVSVILERVRAAARLPSPLVPRQEVRDAVGAAEGALLERIADTTGLTMDQLLGRRPMPSGLTRPAQEEGWRPIETAPKGMDDIGRSRLVYCPGNKCAYTAHWTGEAWAHFAGGGDQRLLFYDPSHWQPLPPAPSEPEEQ